MKQLSNNKLFISLRVEETLLFLTFKPFPYIYIYTYFSFKANLQHESFNKSLQFVFHVCVVATLNSNINIFISKVDAITFLSATFLLLFIFLFSSPLYYCKFITNTFVTKIFATN